ncbi:SMI1/KNR4 family protein [Sphingobacterium griseoflavum]|uniref:Knr4/Smi1-like domain-containing protein n=1 Tax=Sphingobacterium griseoflavum TaxID=1474952 RepID=A0ABQ3HTX6_9SPHI|nr:SMI1/KNR4 family protein [Sphingobacterium griseoflavum]GHE23252.1 hypothetical protein GCM10017764_02200 [Sphingobacterium griseoflavum]
MTNLEIIHTLKTSSFIDENGERYALEFHEKLTDEEIEELRKSFPNRHIDDELAAILRITRGWDSVAFKMVYFDSINEFGFWELSPNSITLGHDGFGNYWVLDIDNEGKLGKVFFACHDPAVFIVHSQNLNEYLQHLLDFHQHPTDNYITNFQINTVSQIWERQNAFLPKAEFIKKNPKHTTFLTTFEGEDWTIADLSSGENGIGFAWGKFRPSQLAQRHPNELIWVLKNRRRNFFARLFS